MNPEREDPRPPELEALLEAARRPGALDATAEERALRSFRTVRDSGEHLAPPRWRRRTRDDWRPAGELRRARSLKAVLAGVLAAAALGGVAVAAGKGVIPSPFGSGEAEPKPGRSAPEVPGGGGRSADDGRGEGTPRRTAGPAPSASNEYDSEHESPKQRPGTARDTVAHCRVYLKAVERRGEAPASVAMARIEEAAGGPEAVPAYCERLLAAGSGKGPGSNPASKPASTPNPASTSAGKTSPADRGKPAKKDAPTQAAHPSAARNASRGAS
ncbi:hypothetical protein [Streptomyces sp. NBC_01506]|uniref:hypothetical protein n=1 Tax=Streptomyces sp. NBC_01506 TaxID=2903887 RepID=UPI003870C061